MNGRHLTMAASVQISSTPRPKGSRRPLDLVETPRTPKKSRKKTKLVWQLEHEDEDEVNAMEPETLHFATMPTRSLVRDHIACPAALNDGIHAMTSATRDRVAQSDRKYREYRAQGPYLGMDTKTPSDPVNDYMSLLNSIARRAMPWHTPYFENSFFPSFATRDIVNKSNDSITGDDLVALYTMWRDSMKTQSPFLYDCSRAIIMPVNDREMGHWSLIVIFPIAKHAILIDSMEDKPFVYAGSHIIKDRAHRAAFSARPSAVVDIYQKLITFSRHMRLLRKHYVTAADEFSTDDPEAKIVEHIRTNLDGSMFDNGDSLSFSLVTYGDPQGIHLDCGVYMMHFCRVLLASSAVTDVLRPLVSKTFDMAKLYPDVRDDGAFYISTGDRPMISVMELFLKERRATVIHDIVQGLADQVTTAHIVSARRNLLEDLAANTLIGPTIPGRHTAISTILLATKAHLDMGKTEERRQVKQRKAMRAKRGRDSGGAQSNAKRRRTSNGTV